MNELLPPLIIYPKQVTPASRGNGLRGLFDPI